MTAGNFLSVGRSVRAYVTLGPLVSFLLLLCSQGIAQQDQNTIAYRLSKVEIVGLQKVSREKFLELSGLQLNQSLKLADLQTVADKLYGSSLFAKIRYRYNWMGELLDVVFEVEEVSPDPTEPSSPVTAKPLVLGKIEFNGLQRCDSTTAIQATMLQVGAPFEQKQLNAAAKRLAGTGYFSEINYNYRKESGQAVALFEVVEFKWDVPCIFDNFVWFTTQELHDAVRKKIPSFEGASPDDEGIPNAIKTVLEQLLRHHRIDRGVNFIISSGNLEDPAVKAKKEFHFLTTGAPMPVCQVNFPGSSATIEKQMQSAIKPLLNVDYSSRQIAQYVENMLVPIYRQRGYLRVKFADPMAQPDRRANRKCQNGIHVSVPVVEGVVYKLGKFEWDGNQSIAISTMQDLFGMKAGATADGAKIDR
ncbi:MAG: hypothetical protein L0226_06865, partial [Acidobacteria bacterium]|nr:hypothetical protein [Acidobacteriota bacterium]